MAVDRLKLLVDQYGFTLPEDLFQSFDVLKRLKPLEPLKGLSETLDVHLVGPFEVLAGRFDKTPPQTEMLLHWRFRSDPPELFTVAVRGEDEMHWGYWLKNPTLEPPTDCLIAGCSPHFRMFPQPVDNSFLGMVRLLLEMDYSRLKELESLGVMMDPEKDQLAKLNRLRDQIGRFVGKHPSWASPETGEDWFLKHSPKLRPLRKRVDNPPTTFTAALSRVDQHLIARETTLALRLVQFLWPKLTPKREEELWPRLEEIYQQSNAPILVELCQLAIRHSKREWVDIAEMEL